METKSEVSPLINGEPATPYSQASGSGNAAAINLSDVNVEPHTDDFDAYEFVVVYDTYTEEMMREGKKSDVQARRDMLEADMRKIRLNVQKKISPERKKTFLLIGATPSRLEEEAERLGLELSLKEEFGGGYAPFTLVDKDMFHVHHSGLFRQNVKHMLLQSMIESDRDDGGIETSFRDLEYHGIIEKAYPMHDSRFKDRVLKEWITKPLVPMPLEDLRNYFGEELAFYFAWLSFYTRWLVGAGILGAIATIIGFTNIPNENGWASTVYSVFIAIWATLFLEFWKQKRNVCAHKWNMLDYEEEEIIRPGFVGDERIGAYSKGTFISLRPDEVYGVSAPRPIKFSPPETTTRRMTAAFGIIVLLCTLVVIATIAILTFRIFMQGTELKTYTSMVGGIMNAVVIMLLNKIYRFIALKMNEWENHRTKSQYNDNLLLKIFLFQFVNSYTSMYYIAFFKRAPSGLWGDIDLTDKCVAANKDGDSAIGWGCPGDLYIQLLTILGTNIVVGQAQEVLIPWVMTKVKTFLYEHKTHKKESDAPAYEREYELNQFEGTVDEYCEMVIQYGYLILFAASIPIAPLLAAVNNVIEARTDTLKLLTSYNRPFYSGADDIGRWYDILQVMGVIAVITNCLLIIFTFGTLTSLTGADPYKILWSVIILEHIILFIKYVVSVFISDVPYDIRELLAKQHYIQQQIFKKYEKKHAGGKHDKKHDHDGADLHRD